MRLGYSPDAGTHVSQCRRFNEAEAHAPRIHFRVGVIGSDHIVASMRPRRMRLGYRVLKYVS